MNLRAGLLRIIPVLWMGAGSCALFSCTQDSASSSEAVTGGFATIIDQIFVEDLKPGDGPKSAADCDRLDDEGRLFAFVPSWLCHLRFDYGLLAVAGSQTISVRGSNVRVVTSAGCTYEDQEFDWRTDIWACAPAKADCSRKTSFTRAATACYSYQTDAAEPFTGNLNRGIIVADVGFLSGFTAGSGGALFRFDIGRKSESRFLSVRLVTRSGALQAEARQLSEAQAQIAAASFSVPGVPAKSFRLAGELDYGTQTGTGYLEGTGLGGAGSEALKSTASGDAALTGFCWERKTTEAGSSSFSAKSFGPACAPKTRLPPVSVEALSGWTFSSLTGSFNGMPVHPDGL